jgi:hypothetical protein
MSLATQAAAAPEVLKFPKVALVVDDAVCFVTKTVAEVVVISVAKQFHPLVAVGSVMTPLVATPPVPTLTVKAPAPFGFTTAAPVPKPVRVGVVVDTKRLGARMPLPT